MLANSRFAVIPAVAAALAMTAYGASAVTPPPAERVASALAATSSSVDHAKRHFESRPARGERVIEVKLRTPVMAAGSTSLKADAISTIRAEVGADKIDRLQPMFDVASPPGRSLAKAASAEAGAAGAELTKWLTVRVAPGVDAKAVAQELNERNDVEIAYVRPRRVEPTRTAATALSQAAMLVDYEPRQHYLRDPGVQGVNAKWAHSQAGGRGEGISVYDIEGGWQLDHPDLQALRSGSVVTSGTPVTQWEFHGTAVMGEIMATENGDGVTGIAPRVTPYVVHVETRERGYNPAWAISTAAGRARAGDVIIVELQTDGCSGNGGGGGYVPQEWIPSAFDAVKAATAKGIHVLEAAGNGSENLDAGCYGNFPSGRGDSGAIIVGAGVGVPNYSGQSCGTPGRRQSFSTYGSRVTSNGWGLCVMTTYDGSGYTSGFSGTSSATPIVTGAVASIAGIARARGITVTPAQMRSLIAQTGTVNASGQGIGTLPDIKRAAEQLGGGSSPTATPTATPTTTPTTSPTVSPTATPTTGTPCASSANRATGSLTAGSNAYHPNGSYLQTTRSGTFSACLIGPSASDFDLYLQRWNGSAWTTVASSLGSSASESLSYYSAAGYYRVRVYSYRGSGSYTVGWTAP